MRRLQEILLKKLFLREWNLQTRVQTVEIFQFKFWRLNILISFKTSIKLKIFM